MEQSIAKSEMADEGIQFFSHSQDTALATFLPILEPHLPESNSLYNRLRAPHNLPSRHCLFAATFPSSTARPPLPTPEVYTILFSDRSRHLESQIWMFNPLITLSSPLSPSQTLLLSDHLRAAIHFLLKTPIPAAPGWPFSPILRFGCIHEFMAKPLIAMAEPRDAIVRATKWRSWLISTAPSTISSIPGTSKNGKPLPEGFSVVRVPEDQLDIVISTSEIPRQPATLLLQPNVGILNGQGTLAAWAYVGIDGSLATLYVLPAYRGKGLARYVAGELLQRLGRGDFSDLGFDGQSGWVHADVKEGNEASEAVMRSLGAEVRWWSHYISVDTDKF